MIIPTTRHRGFTLVEVLLASIIMFSFLAIASLAFKSVRLNSEQAAAITSMLAPVPFITDTIRAQIRANPLPELNGDGRIGDVEYYWTASSVFFLSPPEQLIAETMQVTKYQPRYHLYEVKLKVQLGKRYQEFDFKELAWLPNISVE